MCSALTCPCTVEWIKRKSRRDYVYHHQMVLPFVDPSGFNRESVHRWTPLPVRTQKQEIHDRQPAKWPRGHELLKARDGENWLFFYQQEWIEKRKAAGLPYVINNPVKKPVASARPVRAINDIPYRREGKGAGNAVPGQLCDQRRMTA